MGELNGGQRDLVAIGAALGSNCVPCVEHYLSEARKAGLSDRQIEDAIRVADGVRRVPAQRVLDAALALVSKTVQSETAAPTEAAGTGRAAQPACADGKGSCC